MLTHSFSLTYSHIHMLLDTDTQTCNFTLSLSKLSSCLHILLFCCSIVTLLFVCFQLWALLHFIMPTLFDSHEEFNEWFSKDIESHAENKSAIDESEYFYELSFFLPISVGNYIILYFLVYEEFFFWYA